MAISGPLGRTALRVGLGACVFSLPLATARADLPAAEAAPGAAPAMGAKPEASKRVEPAKKPIGKRTPLSVQLLTFEPSRAPAGAVVRLIADQSTHFEAFAARNGFLKVDGVRTELIDPKGNQVAFEVPPYEAMANYRQGFVSVRLIADNNESVAIRLNLFSPDKTIVPKDRSWTLPNVELLDGGRARAQLSDAIPVEYWGQVKLLVGGVEARILRMHDAAVDVQLPDGATNETETSLYVGRAMPPPFRPAAKRTSQADEANRQQLERLSDELAALNRERADMQQQLARERESSARTAQLVLLGFVIAFALGLAWFQFRYRASPRRGARESVPPAPAASEAAVPATPTPPPPSVAPEQLFVSSVPDAPEELLAACVAGECVLFVGAGLAAQAGLPTRSEVLSELGDMYRSVLETAGLAEVVRANRGDPRIAEVLRAAVGDHELQRAVGRIYDRPRRATPIYEALRQIGFAGVITNSWDELVPTTLRDPWTVSLRDGEGIAAAIRSPRPFLLRLFGDLDEEAGFILVSRDLEQALYENDTAQKAIVQLLLSKTVLFIGSGVAGIDELMSLLRLRTKSSRTHFALVSRNRDTPLDALRLASTHGVRLLPYGATKGHPEVLRFIENLRDDVKRADYVAPAASLSLKRVRLQHIGPFEHLDLELKESWNVLLGNNGCGKSTLLRAVAVGLCGDGAKDWKHAGNLLQTGQPSGLIELDVAGTIYRTELVRDGDKVMVHSATATPLQAKQWAALGFPPLRGASARESTGPGVSGSSHPQLDDVKPLIVGGADSRMDDLKQWVINLSVIAEGTDLEEAGAAVAARDRIFELLGALTPGVDCKFSRLERNPWQVWVKTPDAEVPFGLMSQGTQAVFGWVGTLLLRLHEIHRADTEEVETSCALVLVDEIDAHMHPEWQQTLVPTLRRLLPKLQVIATTHSPLIVGSTQPGEVMRFTREAAGSIQVSVLDSDILTYRADQVLTSPAFSLTSTRGTLAEDKIGRYTHLLGLGDKRSPAERAETDELGEELRSILTTGESPLQRNVERAVSDVLGQLAQGPLLTKKPELAPAAELEAKRQLDRLLAASPEGPGDA